MNVLRTVVVIGAGGHGRVVADIARGQWTGIDVLFLDDRPTDLRHRDVAIAGDTGSLDRLLAEQKSEGVGVIVAIGDNRLRQQMVQRVTPVLTSTSISFATVVDPTAFVSASAILREGTVVMPQAAVNTGSRVGKHVILNTSCSVDHDCVLGDFVHISPGVHLAGGVTLEDGVHVGTGASLVPGVKVGRGSVVGAGSVVVDDIPPGVVAYGVPARVRRAVDDESTPQ